MDAGQASRESCAAALGTIAIETASSFQPVAEAYYLGANAESWRRANLRYYPFYGRGFIQLTWEGNYQSVGDRIGVDLVDDPGSAMEPQTAALIFADYWRYHGRENLILEACNRRDWRVVRRLVQGGDAGLLRLIQVCEDLLG